MIHQGADIRRHLHQRDVLDEKLYFDCFSATPKRHRHAN